MRRLCCKTSIRDCDPTNYSLILLNLCVGWSLLYSALVLAKARWKPEEYRSLNRLEHWPLDLLFALGKLHAT